MTYTPEQIARMARLVPDTDNAWSRARGIPMTTGRQMEDGGAYVIREWQPWADTEAGRSDALVLLSAVCKWIEDNGPYSKGIVTVRQANAAKAMYDALQGGDYKQLQHATCQAALAIGQLLGE